MNASKSKGFALSGHKSISICGDQITVYAARLDNNGESATPRLQVWACPKDNKAGLEAGVLLSESQLAVLDGGFYLESITLDAVIQNSVSGLQYLALVVTRAGTEGAYDALAWMPEPIKFQHPKIAQPVSLVLDKGGLTASVAGVANPRAEGNISGSLVLEAWALKSASAAPGRDDVHLGGIEYIVSAAGETTGPFAIKSAPVYPKGEYYPALVLREWSGTGYLTRDCVVAPQAFAFPPSAKVEAFAKAEPAKAAPKATEAKPAAKKAAVKAAAPKKEEPAKKAVPTKKAAAKVTKKGKK